MTGQQDRVASDCDIFFVARIGTGAGGLGPHGVFWAVAVAESVLAVMAACVFRLGRWKQRVV